MRWVGCNAGRPIERTVYQARIPQHQPNFRFWGPQLQILMLEAQVFLKHGVA